MNFAKNFPQGLRGVRGWALAAALTLPSAACDSLLDVRDPDVASPGSLTAASTLPVQLAGAVGDFQVAYTGTSGASNGPEGLVNLSAIFSDEYLYGSTFPTRLQIDLRSIERSNGTAQTLYSALQRARASAERTSAAYVRFSQTGSGAALAHALSGMTYVLMAETYCNGVPFGELDEAGAPTYRDPLTNAQMYERAVAKFDSAIAFAGGAVGPDTVDAIAARNLARVGKGRALVNLGRFPEAAAAVAAVPTSFNFQIQGSENTGRQQNGIFVHQGVGRRSTVSDREGINGLPYRSDADPRVPNVRGTGNSANTDQGIPLFLQRKYVARASNTPLAQGVEARLIEAEAALRAGGSYLAPLNALRATPPAYFPATASSPNPAFPGIATLTPLTDPGNQAARVSQLFRERAYWMWLTAHRTGDMRRLVRQYDRTQDAVFPTGPYSRAGFGNYGNDVNFPIPSSEDNIPGFTGCLDRAA